MPRCGGALMRPEVTPSLHPVILQALHGRAVKALAALELPEIPGSSNARGLDGLRTLRAKQQQARMQQLRTGG